jgi:hypothetical protein
LKERLYHYHELYAADFLVNKIILVGSHLLPHGMD